jgi:hypothetical protein
MNETEKREFVKYIFATSFIKLVEDYKSADKNRKQDILVYCSALLKRLYRIKGSQPQIDKLSKFLKYVTGMVRIKPPNSDSSDSAEQP